MKSIAMNIKKEIIIKHSKFICQLYQVNSIDEINKIIKDVSDKYSDATHNCYAYIYDQYQKMTDDGEPSGTAGIPILTVLKSRNLNHILAIVTRYFGGIKLGANGLVKAYSNCVKEALNEAKFVELTEGIKVLITFSYPNLKQIDYLLKDYQIINKEYHDNVTYTVLLPLNDDIKLALSNYLIDYQVIEPILIEKEEA